MTYACYTEVADKYFLHLQDTGAVWLKVNVSSCCFLGSTEKAEGHFTHGEEITHTHKTELSKTNQELKENFLSPFLI